MPTIKQEMEALATLSPAQLRAEWRRVFRKDAPPHSPDLLARAIAWRLQARAQGNLTKSARQRLAQLAVQLARGDDVGAMASPSLLPGTRLMREWNDRMIEVVILDDGYQFENRLYTSLSQIAEHVTGAHWSGPRFFGLKRRRKATSEASNGPD
jgi:hypothetical protein